MSALVCLLAMSLEKPPVWVLTSILARSSAYFPVVFLTNTLVNSLACLLAGVR